MLFGSDLRKKAEQCLKERFFIRLQIYAYTFLSLAAMGSVALFKESIDDRNDRFCTVTQLSTSALNSMIGENTLKQVCHI